MSDAMQGRIHGQVTVREVKPGVTPHELQKACERNGLSEVALQAGDKTYIIYGADLKWMPQKPAPKGFWQHVKAAFERVPQLPAVGETVKLSLAVPKFDITGTVVATDVRKPYVNEYKPKPIRGVVVRDRGPGLLESSLKPGSFSRDVAGSIHHGRQVAKARRELERQQREQQRDIERHTDPAANDQKIQEISRPLPGAMPETDLTQLQSQIDSLQRKLDRLRDGGE